MSLRNVISSVVILVVVSLLLWLWFRPRPLTFAPEENVLLNNREVEASPTPAPSIPPATAAEAQQKLDFIFKKALALDPADAPVLVSGDFNGDSSMDLVATVKARPDGLAELNREIPAWITHDATYKPDPVVTPAPVRVEADEPMLVVVHGYEAPGWRNPEAQQAYLLKKVRGQDLRPVPLDKAMAAIGVTANNLRLGDVLAESLQGRPGFLYWSGARYVWRELPKGKTLPASSSAPPS